MALVSNDAFTAAYMRDPQHLYGSMPRRARDAARHIVYNDRGDLRVDVASANALYTALSEYILAGGQLAKTLRPWDINPRLFEGMDRTQPWWGWEFETGWRTNADRLAAVRHVWDNYDGCMFDAEGEGDYQVEITFIPATMQEHLNGTASANLFVQWMNDNPNRILRTGNNNVGTHLNMSHPLLNRNNAKGLAAFLNRTLQWSRHTNGQRQQMFGRESIYAGFFHNISNGGANNWLEFKGFRTAYDAEGFQNYIKVASAFQKIINTYLESNAERHAFIARNKLGIRNLYDVVYNGARPLAKNVERLELPRDAAPLGTRSMGRMESFGTWD